MNVGERIKKRRKELGLSADYVASKLNISRSTVFRYEKGEIEKLPTSILEDLSNVLQTTPAFLMGWEEEEATDKQNKVDFDSTRKNNPHMVIAAHMDDDLSEEEMQEIRDFIEFVKSKRK